MITVKGDIYELDCQQVTPRQAEFIILLAEGYTQRQMASLKGISYQAVTARLNVAKGNLEVNTPTAMVAKCFAEGWMRKQKETEHA